MSDAGCGAPADSGENSVEHTWSITEQWKCKPQGQVWRVADKNGRTGFFKFAFRRQWYYAGPLVGNEWIARRLATEAGLSSAQVEVAHIRHGGAELFGIVSLPRQGARLLDWSCLSDAERIRAADSVHQMNRLVGTIAFDSWLTNIDRGSGRNVILYKDGDERYRWYLIDHAYALYGSPRKWEMHGATTQHWLDIWRFYHIPRGWQKLATRGVLWEMAERIRRVPRSYIQDVIASVPDPSYSDRIKRDVSRMLLYRKSALPHMLDRWMQFRGRKESMN